MVRYLMFDDDVLRAKVEIEAIGADEGERVRATLVALAQRLADFGTLRGGKFHRLESPFEQLYEFKPGNYRAIAYRKGNVYVIVRVVRKASKKAQNNDYRSADKIRNHYYNGKP